VSKPKKVYVIILNWNGWADTLECLESVFRMDYPNYRVIVCDNNSHDGSLEKIREWAQGRLLAPSGNFALADSNTPSHVKPISFVELDRSAADAGGLSGGEPPLILIKTGANLGFAGGNNVGLRYALARGDFEYAWLLNNDTIVKPDSLLALVARMEKSANVGICGSTLIYYHSPDRIQALGGSRYNRWRCRATPIGAMQAVDSRIDPGQIERDMDYVAGASMMVSRRFLQEVGLMREDYFLYFEEFDWARRARGRFALAYAPASIVYHKEGGSIGTYAAGRSSSLSIFYLQKNRIKFVSRFFKRYLPFLYLSIALESARALLRRDFFELKWVMLAVLGIRAKGMTREKRNK
jgi:hypothetical protein